jgi:hypothetical protein
MIMSIYVGQFAPKVTELVQRLNAAKAKLAALPRPSVLDTALSALPWENAESGRAQAVATAEAEVQQLRHLLAVAERSTVQHLIDLLECIPQERDNFTIIREALIYARALAQIEEQTV